MQHRRPRFIVLMATRNGEAWLMPQVESILHQRDVDIRLLIRDDGSSDKTAQLLTELAVDDSRVSVLTDSTPTGSAAGNFFILIDKCEIGEADFVALADQDDEWLPEKLSRAAQELKRTGAAAYSAAVCAMWADGRVCPLTQNPFIRKADFLFEGAGQGCSFVMTSAFFGVLQKMLCVHRSSFSRLHYHDWAIYALCRAEGLSWHFDESVCMRYRQHGTNDTGARASGHGIRRRMHLIRQGWYRQQVSEITQLVREIHPDNVVANQWTRIALHDAGSTGKNRWARLQFVFKHGRRRPMDRAVQVLAVALGYL
jgi:rhamnosyltransferase